MSIKAMNWAWEQNLPPGSKLVLMALADNADDQGYCWPKIKTIAAKCCVSERTAQRLVKDLLDSGLLKISARFNALGGQVSNGYTLEMYPPDKLSPSPALIQEGGDSRDTPGVTQLCHPYNHHMNPKKNHHTCSHAYLLSCHLKSTGK